jgi:hypothetical protein
MPHHQLVAALFLAAWHQGAFAQASTQPAVVTVVSTGQQFADACAAFWQADPPVDTVLVLGAPVVSLRAPVTVAPISGGAHATNWLPCPWLHFLSHRCMPLFLQVRQLHWQLPQLPH